MNMETKIRLFIIYTSIYNSSICLQIYTRPDFFQVKLIFKTQVKTLE